MFKNDELSRKVKTQISQLEHTFGKNINSVDDLGNVPQTRIRLLDSFQHSYLSENSKAENSKSDMSASAASVPAVSQSELKALYQQLADVKEKATAEMIAAETSKCLVEMERTVGEYLEERLRKYAEKGRTATNITKNKGASRDHLKKLAKEYLECSINYEKNLRRLEQSYHD